MSNGFTEGVLGDICQIKIGGTPARNNPDYWDAEKQSGNSWVSIRDLSTPIVTMTAEQITNNGVLHSNAKLVKTGTVLMSFKLTVGRVAYAGKDLYTNEAIAALENPKVDPNFLYYGLQNWDLLANIDTAIKGVTLNKAKLVQIPVLYPADKCQQAKIAQVLATVDRALAQTAALLAKQQRVKAGLIQELLMRGIDADGNRRDPRTHVFKDSPLGPIPVEWEIGRLETKKCARPYLKTGPFGTQLKGEHWVDEGVPVITIGSLGEGKFVEAELLFITSVKAKSLAACSVLPGDLVFSRVADVGRSVVVGPMQSGWVMSSNLMRISLDQRLAVPEFVQANIAFSHFTRKQLRASVNASGREVANTPILDQLLFAWPSYEEQQKIANIIDVQQKNTDTEQSEHKKLQSLKQGLMQDLLTGRVSVLSLLDESI